jgi:hypothetical protein
MTLAVTYAGSQPSWTFDFVFYLASGTHALFLETDQAGVVGGEANAQQGGPFNAASVMGTYVVSLLGFAQYNGEAVQLGDMTVDGAGIVSSYTTLECPSCVTLNLNGTYEISQAGQGIEWLNGQQTNFAIYITSPSEIILIGADPTNVFLGKATKQ